MFSAQSGKQPQTQQKQFKQVRFAALTPPAQAASPAQIPDQKHVVVPSQVPLEEKKEVKTETPKVIKIPMREKEIALIRALTKLGEKTFLTSDAVSNRIIAQSSTDDLTLPRFDSKVVSEFVTSATKEQIAACLAKQPGFTLLPSTKKNPKEEAFIQFKIIDDELNEEVTFKIWPVPIPSTEENWFEKMALVSMYTRDAVYCGVDHFVKDPIGRAVDDIIKKQFMFVNKEYNAERYRATPGYIFFTITTVMSLGWKLADEVKKLMIEILTENAESEKNLLGAVNQFIFKQLNTPTANETFAQLLKSEILSLFFPELVSSLRKHESWVKHELQNLQQNSQRSLNDIYMIFVVCAYQDLEAKSQNMFELNNFFADNLFLLEQAKNIETEQFQRLFAVYNEKLYKPIVTVIAQATFKPKEDKHIEPQYNQSLLQPSPAQMQAARQRAMVPPSVPSMPTMPAVSALSAGALPFYPTDVQNLQAQMIADAKREQQHQQRKPRLRSAGSTSHQEQQVAPTVMHHPQLAPAVIYPQQQQARMYPQQPQAGMHLQPQAGMYPQQAQAAAYPQQQVAMPPQQQVGKYSQQQSQKLSMFQQQQAMQAMKEKLQQQHQASLQASPDEVNAQLAQVLPGSSIIRNPWDEKSAPVSKVVLQITGKIIPLEFQGRRAYCYESILKTDGGSIPLESINVDTPYMLDKTRKYELIIEDARRGSNSKHINLLPPVMAHNLLNYISGGRKENDKSIDFVNAVYFGSNLSNQVGFLNEGITHQTAVNTVVKIGQVVMLGNLNERHEFMGLTFVLHIGGGLYMSNLGKSSPHIAPLDQLKIIYGTTTERLINPVLRPQVMNMPQRSI